MNAPVVLLGAGGMLGCELVRRLRGRLADPQLRCFTKADLDITDRDATAARLSALRPGTVINTAAYTDVDACETKTEHAMAVNAVAPGVLGEACKVVAATLVHIGTDFVFDGRSSRPYRPDDCAAPICAYGRSKWEGEQAIGRSGCDHLIVRTSWLFGPAGRNFVEAILDKAQSGQRLRVVDDQVGRPTLAGDLAEAILRLLDGAARGVFHFANAGACSWHEFATEIVTQADLAVGVDAIKSEQLGRPARRPKYSVLDTTDYEQRTGHQPRPWREALSDYMRQRRQVAV